MVTERGTSLALDRICVRQEVVETVVRREPLRSSFGTDPGNAGKMVSIENGPNIASPASRSSRRLKVNQA